MASNNDTIGKTLTVATLLCLVCAIIVSGAAVSLKPDQIKNKALDMRKNILMAGGLMDESKTVEEQFEQIETRIVNIETGKYATEAELEEIKAAGYDISNFDQRKATKDPKLSRKLAKSEDPAGLKYLGKYAPVYLVKSGDKVDRVILPVSGYALWSTLYGFVALEGDFNTVVGLGFYEHAETPGLGGEIDNPVWKAKWTGKQIQDANGAVSIEVVKGKVVKGNPSEIHQVDGLSGATLTANGVKYLMQFWMGDLGFAKFIANLKAGAV